MRERKTFVSRRPGEQTAHVGKNAVVLLTPVWSAKGLLLPPTILASSVLGEFCFSLSREGLEEPFGSHEIGKENHL
ncbi:hypothetical protein KSB_69690 [Ktedonobacter robiniae]|uniref:Uncharacterized protein n=1 Tax=Ktedonobacter robiniae TaxID=2778365 RepID=A0ABQ3V0T0_9CHLR|nr:hypothetical protein KSB_69690 [Ktedonobacter robiniae]